MISDFFSALKTLLQVDSVQTQADEAVVINN